MAFSSHPDVFGNSGVFLQFIHSRLCGIERQCDVTLDTAVVDHDEAFEVFDTVAQFPYVMHQALDTMEPSLLVTYLFKLARTTNQALYRLRIKGAPPHLANSRWTLFWAAKQTLANGLAVLGLEAVSRM
jgi:arginyl-tRNA synthetase